MIKLFIAFSIMLLRIYLPTDKNITPPFTNQQVVKAPQNDSSKIENFKGQILQHKVWLQWNVSQNESTYKFDVEKSTDGQHFRVAALVFSSEKNDADQYLFFENASHRKIMYRIKLFEKDNRTTYSKTIVINPKN
ncbi:MAG: hypothetical protein KDC06_00230 [Chitinophagaceae bacterium]|nr:hypothetical protein [Chitinophagaceae bacterium]